MHLYSVTIFDRKAPDCQVHIALWAQNRPAAYKRGLACGQVVDVQPAIGSWPLDAHRRLRAQKRSNKS